MGQKGRIWTILALSVVMIGGLTGVVIGLMFLFVDGPRGPSTSQAVLLLIGGAIIGLWSLRHISLLNQAYQDTLRQSILDDTKNIVLQWEEDGQPVVLARTGLVFGAKVYPFATFYLRLVGLDWQPPTLLFTFKQFTGRTTHTEQVHVTVPPEHRDELAARLEELSNMGAPRNA